MKRRNFWMLCPVTQMCVESRGLKVAWRTMFPAGLVVFVWLNANKTRLNSDLHMCCIGFEASFSTFGRNIDKNYENGTNSVPRSPYFHIFHFKRTVTYSYPTATYKASSPAHSFARSNTSRRLKNPD